jgi:hypothetical protein
MIRAGILLCAVSLALAGSEPAVVWNLDDPQSRTGKFSAFQSPDCEIDIRLTSEARRGNAGRGMEISYRSRGGPCGLWMHLFDEGAPAEHRYSDTRKYPFLSFWVRGASVQGTTGMEDAEVRMADPVWLARDDSKPAGPISRYLRGPVTQLWNEVVVPYGDFHLPSPLAAVFVLSFPTGTEGVLQVDDVALKRRAGDRVPLSVARNVTRNAASSRGRMGTTMPRAMWLWETAQAIATEELRSATIANLVRARVGLVFLQVPYTARGPDSATEFSIPQAAELRSFLRSAHSAGIGVHALDGYPEFILREMRPKVLGLIQEILAFNRGSSPSERFDGIHLDVEPYQLLGFDSPLRQSLLVEFLELQQEIRASLRREQAPLAYGIDIPFWLHGEKVVFEGAERDATLHLLEFADNVGIMAYRRSATGEDSVVATSAVTVAQAGEAGKTAFIGVETAPVGAGSRLSIVCTVPEAAWRSPDNLAWPLLRKSNIDGFSLRSRSDGETRSVGLAASSRRDTGAYYSALEALAAACRQWPGPAGEMAESIPPLQVTESGQAKITFAGSKLARFEEAIGEVSDAFFDKAGFGGIAINSYSAWLNLH